MDEILRWSSCIWGDSTMRGVRLRTPGKTDMGGGVGTLSGRLDPLGVGLGTPGKHATRPVSFRPLKRPI
jgi:hypothetical protein